MVVEIRQATKDDLKQLTALFMDNIDGWLSIHGRIKLNRNEKSSIKQLHQNEINSQDDSNIYLVAISPEHKRKIVGYLRAKIRHDYHLGECVKIGEIIEIFVHKDFRRQHVGLSLFIQCTDWFKENDVSRIEIEIPADHDEYKEFLSKLGFAKLSIKYFRGIEN